MRNRPAISLSASAIRKRSTYPGVGAICFLLPTVATGSEQTESGRREAGFAGRRMQILYAPTVYLGKSMRRGFRWRCGMRIR